MNVVIDGIEYAPMHSAIDKGGRIKSISRLMLEGRKHKRWTLAIAAKQSGLSLDKVHRAESGDVSLETVVALSDVYGIPMDQIARAVRRRAEP